MIDCSRFVFVFIVGFAACQTLANSIESYDFEDPTKEAQFKGLIEEFRCPKCQNQTLADSNAGLAGDLKKRIYTLVNEGRSDQYISDYLVARYGDFITYDPPLRATTYLLWFGPFLLLALAFILVTLKVKRSSRLLPPAENHSQGFSDYQKKFGLAEKDEQDIKEEGDS